MTTFAGKWQTTFGPMELTQDGKRLRGSYSYMGIDCAVSGRIARGGRFTFKYREPTVRGEGWFELTRRGTAFAGQYQPEGADRWGAWEGERVGFDGLWNTSFGLMRLVEEGDRVHGYYETDGGSTIDGRRSDARLTFAYREPRHRGRGRFELAADGLSFQGEWRAQGASDWRPWTGIRVRPQPNRTFLVVIEAPWMRWLGEREYSFGNMLREFFARVPQVEVRQRYFTNEAGLRKCCRELLYIAEPVVLLVATHARPGGITVDGQTIGVRALAEALRYAGDLRLLHFSACLMLQDPEVVEFLRGFAAGARLPISGYTTSVDWAASAIIEFTYLDLILSKGLAPAAAAEQLKKHLPFAGDIEVKGGTYLPAGFTFLPAADPAAPVRIKK